MRRLLELTTALGGCERTSILRTPIYTPYLTRTIHLSRFLFLWLALRYTSRDVPSPRSLVGPVGTIPISAAVTDFMLGIEDIGVRIEQPFDVLLPLWQYVKTAVDASCGQILAHNSSS